MKTFILLSFFLTLSPYSFANQEASVFFNEKNNRLHYQGKLSEQGIAKLKNLYREHKQAITWLEITSTGGEITLGMDLGDFINEHQLNVSVKEYCLSSCANYVFTSARKKELGKHALIGFHGGASSKQFDNSTMEQQIQAAPKQHREAVRAQMIKLLNDYLEVNSKREKVFFKKIGVKQEITTLGQTDIYKDIESSGAYVGWYYSVDDLNKLGVNNIKLIDGSWKLKQLSEDKKVFKVKVIPH